MVAHATLTGSELHECKGADSAASNTVRVSNGSGSGTWQKITSSSIDTSSIKNVNVQTFAFLMTDPTLPSGTIYLPLEQNKTISSVHLIVNNTVAGTLTATIKKNSSTIGTISVASTTAGTTGSSSPATSLTTSDTFSIVFSGTSTSSFTVLVSFTL